MIKTECKFIPTSRKISSYDYIEYEYDLPIFILDDLEGLIWLVLYFICAIGYFYIMLI